MHGTRLRLGVFQTHARGVVIRHHYRLYPLGAERVDGNRQRQGRVDTTGQPKDHTLEAVLVDVITHPGNQRLIYTGFQLRHGRQRALTQPHLAVVELHINRIQPLAEGRNPAGDLTIAVHRYGAAIKHQLVLAADLVHIDDRH